MSHRRDSFTLRLYLISFTLTLAALGTVGLLLYRAIKWLSGWD